VRGAASGHCDGQSRGMVSLLFMHGLAGARPTLSNTSPAARQCAVDNIPYAASLDPLQVTRAARLLG